MPEAQRKVCLLGDFAVGKTSLVRRFVEGRFDERYLSTIGVSISRKPVPHAGGTVNLIIWDLAGSNGFMPSYLMGARGAILVADLARPDTVGNLPEYAAQIRAVNPEAALVIAGNKLDLVDAADSRTAVSRAAAAVQAPWLLTSAKEDTAVETLFLQLVQQIEDRS